MKIYEMIYYKGSYEQTCLFYAVNNKTSREHFIDHIRLELDTELNGFKQTCTSDSKADLLCLFKEIHHESFFHLNAMADVFIENSTASFDQYIHINVEEHNVLDI